MHGTCFEWSAQWWAILLPLKSFYEQLSLITLLVPFRIQSESLAIKGKKRKERGKHMFSLILPYLMSHDPDWYFSCVFRLVFPASWSAHDLSSLGSDSVCLFLLIHCASSRQVKPWCSSGSLLIHVFIAQHILTTKSLLLDLFLAWLLSCLGLVESCEWMLKACFVLPW